MGKRCPCGCGSKVPFGKGGAAKGFARFQEDRQTANEVFDRYLAQEAVDDDSRQVIEGWRRQAAVIETGYLLHLHGDARPDNSPDLLSLHRKHEEWEQAALRYLKIATGTS